MTTLLQSYLPLYNGKKCHYSQFLELAEDGFQYEII